MALTFAHCRSCGGKTQVNLKIAGANRRCMLCGEPCSAEGEMEMPEDSPGAEKDRQAHQPVERVMTNCPKCQATIAVVPDLPAGKQRCDACGHLFRELPSQRKRHRKVSRMTADGLLRKRTRERVWMPMLGTMLVVIVAAIFGLWMHSRKEPKMAEQAVAVPPDQREQIEKQVTAFLTAKSAEELLPLLREPQKSGPMLHMWLGAHPGSLPVGGQIEKIGLPRDAGGALVSVVMVSFPDGKRKAVHTVETPEGFRVDWRAFSETGDMTVEQFVTQKPATPTLLIAAVRRSDYYNGAYRNYGEWECLKVSTGNGEHSFFAYVPRRNAALMAAFAALPPLATKRGQADAPKPMALRVRFVHESAADTVQTEVESVVGQGWYVP